MEINQLLAGDRRALARSITLIESDKPEDQNSASILLQAIMPHCGNSIRIGITGVPGVGKSTLIEILGTRLIERGHKVAVLAVDPSSSLSGGSIMGDKTRMPTLATNLNAFVRPTPAGKTLGGVARRTRESIILCEAAGFDIVIVETVGVGQSETLVSEMTDMFVLMLLPGGGDELQGIKRGIMELADMVVINKADDDLAARATLSAADIQQALRLIKQRHPDWQAPVLTASARDEVNIDEIWKVVQQFFDSLNTSGILESNRSRQALSWFWNESREMLLSALKGDSEIQSKVDEIETKVLNGEIPPSIAARLLVSNFLNKH